MILQNNCDKLQHSFVKFKDDFLENAKEYEYLGCTIKSNGSLVNSSLDLKKKYYLQYKYIYLILVRLQLRYIYCMINSNGSLVNSSLDFKKEAKEVLFSIKAYTSDYGQIPVKVACNLFATSFKPILTYNSEIRIPTLNCLELHYVQKKIILKLMNQILLIRLL